MTREELISQFSKDIGEALGTHSFPSVLDHLEDLLDFANTDLVIDCQHELEIGE